MIIFTFFLPPLPSSQPPKNKENGSGRVVASFEVKKKKTCYQTSQTANFPAVL